MKCNKCGNIIHGRSNNENSYYWSVVVKMIADEVGQSTQQTHEDLKYNFNYGYVKDLLTGKKVRTGLTTTDLTTAEFEDYLERIRRWAAEFLRLFIPDPQ